MKVSTTENITATTELDTRPVIARMTGMVKWFNNKAGFGFITVCGDGSYSGKDIFAHYSGIRVTNSQYKYLVQGEYVDFDLTTSTNETHEFHAADICGVLGGSIMCETRRNSMPTLSSNQRTESRDDRRNESVQRPDSRSAPRVDRSNSRVPDRRYRVREDKPRQALESTVSGVDDGGFVRVERNRVTKTAPKTKSETKTSHA